MDKIQATAATEKVVRAHLDTIPYSAQKLNGFAGPHTLTASTLGIPAVMRSRPMVQIFNGTGELVDEVPLPISRIQRTGGRRGKPAEAISNYTSVVTDPVYSKAPWAHAALQKLAAEYDRLDATGLGELYAHFHGAPHRLAIIEKGADVLQLIANKVFNNMKAYHMYHDERMNADVGYMSTQAISPGVYEHFLTLNAENYVKFDSPVLGHELSHRIDLVESNLTYCYSGNVLFEHALAQDISALKKSSEKINTTIIYPLFSIDGFYNNKEETRQQVATELFATLFEEWLVDPEQMQRNFPCIHSYIVQYVLPDLRLRQKTGNDDSYLDKIISDENGKELLQKLQQSLPEQPHIIDTLADLRYSIERDEKYASKTIHEKAHLFVDQAAHLISQLTPSTNSNAVAALQNLRDASHSFQQTMLEHSGLSEMPAPFGPGPRYTGR